LDAPQGSILRGKREAIAELRELLRKDFRTLSKAEEKRADALFIAANKHACCLVEQLKEYVPYLIRNATWSYLFGRACEAKSRG
jgi:hypothetical protein